MVISLQWGLGHCGEHASASFQVLAAIMNAGHAAKFETVIRGGNANIDHAFVVGGFKAPQVMSTRLSKDFYLGAMDNDIMIFDLRDELAINPGKDGFVCDPYLAPEEQRATCKALLQKLNDKDHEKRKIHDKTIVDVRTDCLLFTAQHPPRPASPPAPPPTKVLGMKGL